MSQSEFQVLPDRVEITAVDSFICKYYLCVFQNFQQSDLFFQGCFVLQSCGSVPVALVFLYGQIESSGRETARSSQISSQPRPRYRLSDGKYQM